MKIRICLDRAEPPAGRLFVGAQEGEGIGFAGWLGLLRALEEAVGSLDERAADAE